MDVDWSEELFVPGAFVFSTAVGVNDAGDLCGYRNTGAVLPEAFFLMQLGSLEEQPLPSLVDNRKQYTTNLYALALNNASIPQIVGVADILDRKNNRSGPVRPLVFTHISPSALCRRKK